jgi:hypothetical protein
MLSSNLHTRRRSHFSDYDDDDEDMDMGESFAYGDFSGAITTFDAHTERGLAPVPELQELGPPSDDRASVSNEQALVAHSVALVPRYRSVTFASDENEEEDQPREVAVITPVLGGDTANSLALRQSRAIDAPSVAETALARPQETALGSYTPKTLVPADFEDELVSSQQQQFGNSDHSSVTRKSRESALSLWDGYDERTLTSKVYVDDDENH